MDITSVLNWLTGGDSPKTYGPDPPHFPTSDDAAFARKYDYSYGQPYAPYFTGDRANLLTGDPNKSPLPMQGVSGQRMEREGLGDYYARAALALNNSPLASLGFDPSKTAADVYRDPKAVNILGTYTPKTDEIYANAQDPSAIVHESIHRGMNKLRDSPVWDPDWGEMVNQPAMNEAVVRMLMKHKMGDPEVENMGTIGKKQQDWAEAMFNLEPRYQRKMNAMEDAASRYIAQRRPMGPR